jgi:hypothetical protein
MVHLKKQRFIGIFFIAGILTLIKCNSNTDFGSVNCDECYTPKPDSVDMVLNLTINNEYPEIPVLIYHGNVNSGVFIDTFFCTKSRSVIYLKAEETYSAKAIYKSAARTVIVVDGVQQKLNEVTGDCSDNCWTVSGTNLDLELAY